MFSPKLVNNFKGRVGGGIFSKLTKNEGSKSSMTNNKIVQEQMKWQQKYPNNSLNSFKGFMPVNQAPTMKNSKSAVHGKYQKILHRGKSQSLGGSNVPTIVINPEAGDATNLNLIMPTFAATSKTIPSSSNFIISNKTIRHVAQDGGDPNGETYPTKSSSIQSNFHAPTVTSARLQKQYVQPSPRFIESHGTGKFMSFSNGSNSQPHIGQSLITTSSRR